MPEAAPSPKPPHRCGVAALAGPPNCGKSTLLNAMVGEKVSITAPRPQTTRLTACGIVTRPHCQIIWQDTPGLLEPEDLLGKGMLKAAADAFERADVVVLMISPDTAVRLKIPEDLKWSPDKSILAVNKTDAYSREKIDQLALRMHEKYGFHEVVNLSAKRRTGLDTLEKAVAVLLPEGEAVYPEDEFTDQTLRQSAAEIIREKALLCTREEVPHAVAVKIDEYVEKGQLHRIRATLFVEKETQKGILIGRNGVMLKKIGTAARKDLEELSRSKVFLELWVKTAKNWKKDARFLRELGFSSL